MIRMTQTEVLSRTQQAVDPSALRDAASIVEDIRHGGEDAIRKYAARFDGTGPSDRLLFGPADLETAFQQLPDQTRRLVERTASRIGEFAMAQLTTLGDLSVAVPGGRAGHTLRPVACVGAYAPGGRYPLPSTVLMTVIPAKVAGVPQVWLASPRPIGVTLAAAHIAGASGVVSLGGAQAIAALAFGSISPRCDLIVGPGNKWVTAAKKYLFGEVGIDGLAGPSEILVVADDQCDPNLVARDLVAQAEHDPEALPMLVAMSAGFVDRVESEIVSQLRDLPTASIARASLDSGMAVVVSDMDAAATISNAVAPEHLAIHATGVNGRYAMFTAYGSMFIGAQTAEAHADYGVGPNHVLPTNGSARFASGLSVSTFLRTQTWLQLSDSYQIAEEVADFARLEGLEGHARAAVDRGPSFDG